jgi:hypothetical protein
VEVVKPLACRTVSGRHRTPEPTPVPKLVKVRNGSNWLSGRVLGWGLLGAAIALDPLAVYRRPVDGQGLDTFWLIATGVMAAVGCLAYLVFGRPVLLVEESRLVIVNPFRVWTVPLGSVDSVDETWPYPRVRAQGRRIFVAALEESNLDLLRGGSGRVTDLVATAADHTVDSVPAPPEQLSYRWSFTDRTLKVLLACWVSYVLAGVVRAWLLPWT